MSNTASTTTTKSIDIKLNRCLGDLNMERLLAMETNINLNPFMFDAETICRFVYGIIKNYIIETEVVICIQPTRLVFADFSFLEPYGSMLQTWVIDNCYVTENKCANRLEIELLCRSTKTPITINKNDIPEDIKKILTEKPCGKLVELEVDNFGGSATIEVNETLGDWFMKQLCDNSDIGYDGPVGYVEDDPVNHPSHYTSMSIETIDLMEEAEGREAVEDYCICNCWKYLSRHGKKDDDIQDMKKLVWYANRYIQMKEEDEDVD